MKNVLMVVLASTAMLGLSACNDYSSPAGVLGTAQNALKKEDSKAFRKTLTGEALKQYGNLKAMSELKTRMAGAAKVGSTTLLKTEKEPFGMQETRTYRVEVQSKDNRAMLDATVVCDVRFEFSPCAAPNRANYCYPDADGYFCRGGNPTSTSSSEYWCSRDSWEHPFARVETSSCKISELTVLN